MTLTQFKNLKIGDKVKIRSDLKVHYTYGNEMFISSMRRNLGAIVTIGDFILDEFTIEEDGNCYFYTFEMINNTFIFGR